MNLYFEIIKNDFIPPLYQNNAHSMYYFISTFKTPITGALFTKLYDSYSMINFYRIKNVIHIVHFEYDKTYTIDLKLSELENLFNQYFFKNQPIYLQTNLF